MLVLVGIALFNAYRFLFKWQGAVRTPAAPADADEGWGTRVLPYLALVAVVVGFGNFFWYFAEAQRPGGGGGSGGSVALTHPLAMAGLAYLLFRFVFPSALGSRTGEAVQERVRAVRAAGPKLAAGRYSGRVGELTMSGPLLRVEVWPAGIVLQPVFMGATAILKEEIGEVSHGRSFLRGGHVRVDHRSPDTRSPLVVYAAADSDLARAIEQLASGAVVDR